MTKNDENGEARPSIPSRPFRRSGPSPRIQALAERFESTSSTLHPMSNVRAPPITQPRRASVQVPESAESVTRPQNARKTSLPPVYDGLPFSTSANDHPLIVRGALGQMNWQPIRNIAGPSKSFVQSRNSVSDTVDSSKAKGPTDSGNGEKSQLKDPINILVHSHLNPAPAQPLPPSVRRVDAAPIKPLQNISLEMKPQRQGKDKRNSVEGSKRTSPNIPNDNSRQTEIPPFSNSPEPETPESTHDKDAFDEGEDDDDDDEKPLFDPHSDDDDGGDRISDVQAIPASDVFAKDAMPLYLPDLDEYLSDMRYFDAPRFATRSASCSDEEASLYGLRGQSSLFSSNTNFEVCGDQISLPPTSIAREGLRKRRTGKTPTNSAPTATSEDELKSPISDTSIAQVALNGSSSSLAHDSSNAALSQTSSQTQMDEQAQVFPPLMLLKNATLDELKSNAVGPRKPPGGFIGSLPGIGSLVGTIVDFVVGVEGSTLAAGIFRLQMLLDFVQIMNLNLHFTDALRLVTSDASKWNPNYVLLHAVPSILSLDFVSVFGAAVIILLVFTGIVDIFLALFWRMTRLYNPNRTLEGYQAQPWLFRLVSRKQPKKCRDRTGHQLDDQVVPWRSTVWTKFINVSVVMILTIFYIPLSKLAVDVLVWSSDYWPAEAKNATTTTGMQGFCYRTTLNTNEFNWAYVVIPVAVLTVALYTLWYPYQMMRTIDQLLPRVDEYNELGNKRTNGEMETEYMRMLSRDASPLNFMYNAYRRKWGTYKPLYILFFKLSNLLIISIFTQQNCLFHNVDTRKMLVIQQSVLIGLQATLLAVHLFVQPYIDMLSNRNELMGRTAYVLTAVIGLLVALQVHGSTVYQSTVLYVIQGLTYTFNIYFSIAGTSWMSHLVKRAQSRIDFSIDIFSPTLLLDKHIKRRIWQETLSTILLSAPEYRMPIAQLVTFSINDDWPPYLLQFQGTAAERHVENLKIVKSVGMDAYKESVERLREQQDADRWQKVMKRIQMEFAGPDAYWQPLNANSPKDQRALKGVSSYFGKAFLVPFPPTIVMSYDQSSSDERISTTLQLTTLVEFEQFVWQNESEAIGARRWVRMVLRALDGQTVRCPHVEAQKVSAQSRLQAWLGGLEHGQSQYTLAKPVFYEEGVLRVERKATPTMGDYNFEAGFDVFITYPQGQRRDPDGISVDRTRVTIDATAAFGLRDDFDFTQSVDRFFRDNEASITLRLPQMRQAMHAYRLRFFREALEKRKTMAYAFLTDVFDVPVRHAHEFNQVFHQSSGSHVVRSLPNRYPAASSMLVARMQHVTQTRIHKWWYIFWDDFWRQNSGDYAALRNHRQTFHPHCPSSIAYTPMPRDRLEALLKSKANIWSEADQTTNSRNGSDSSKTAAQKGLFNRGLLNRVYFMLDEAAFDRSLRLPGERQPGYGRGQPLIVGTQKSDGTIAVRSLATISATSKSKSMDKDAVFDVGNADDKKNDKRLDSSSPYYYYMSDPFAASSRHTGGGTDHDVDSIIERYAWPWTEERMSGRPSPNKWTRFKGRVLEWLSIRPYKLHDDVSQLYIYLKIVDGHYEAASRPSVRRSRA